MKNTTLLKKLILDNEILVMPGAYDAAAARIIEQTGFNAVTLGGYPTSASLLGKPDVSLLTLTEMAAHTRNIAEAVDIPVFTDGDTGYGNVINVARTVHEFERAGAAGMFIEDQIFPKRCGHMEGKQVIPADEMLPKIKAAVDARHDQDFIIMARTDALAIHGVREAIVRANKYGSIRYSQQVKRPKSLIVFLFIIFSRACCEAKGEALRYSMHGNENVRNCVLKH